MNPSSRDYHTAHLNNAQHDHRYRSKGERWNVLPIHIEGSQPETFDYMDFAKTIDFKQCDDTAFSDNKIKNYTPRSTYLSSQRRRVPIYQKQAAGKRIIQSILVSPSPSKDTRCVEAKHVPDQSEQFKPRGRILSARQGHSSAHSKKYQLEGSVTSSRPANSAFQKRRKGSRYNKSTQIKADNNFTPLVICLKPPPKYSEPAYRSNSSKKEKCQLGIRMKSKTVKNVLTRGAVGQHLKKPTGTMSFNVPDQKNYLRIGGWQHDNPSFNEFDEMCSSSEIADSAPTRDVRTSWGQRHYLQPKYV